MEMLGKIVQEIEQAILLMHIYKKNNYVVRKSVQGIAVRHWISEVRKLRLHCKQNLPSQETTLIRSCTLFDHQTKRDWTLD